MKKAIERIAADAGVPAFTQYSLRHVMATTVRRLTPGVSREQRSRCMGHMPREGSRTIDRHEAFDPRFPADVALATDVVMAE
ncbi:MAG TPA: hypothetical protein VEA41_01765 [Salinarimonas sp.]|nr:hypothetical protein [Salinarimonas sp.]